MYNPQRFQGSDTQIQEIVNNYPFATLITGKHISHVPLILEPRNNHWHLIGHLARANEHWKHLESESSTAIFHGPHAYVTPNWYSEHDVPTWNYVVAHLEGRGRLLENAVPALKTLSHRTDPDWEFAIPDDLQGEALNKAIVAFEIEVTARHGKIKLSQNRRPQDIDGVLRGLATRRDEGSQGVLAWMRRVIPG